MSLAAILFVLQIFPVTRAIIHVAAHHNQWIELTTKMKLPTTSYQLQTNKGFTLIELLLYVATVSLFVFAIGSLYVLILQSRVKNQVIAEVEQQGLQVMQIITQTIRNGTAINSPTQTQSAASVSVNVTDSAKSPTVFDVSSGAVRATEGANSPVSLTSPQVVASSLNIQNLSRTGTPNTIRISLTLNYANPAGRGEYSYSKTFYASASLRK